MPPMDKTLRTNQFMVTTYTDKVLLIFSVFVTKPKIPFPIQWILLRFHSLCLCFRFRLIFGKRITFQLLFMFLSTPICLLKHLFHMLNCSRIKQSHFPTSLTFYVKLLIIILTVHFDSTKQTNIMTTVQHQNLFRTFIANLAVLRLNPRLSLCMTTHLYYKLRLNLIINDCMCEYT